MEKLLVLMNISLVISCVILLVSLALCVRSVNEPTVLNDIDVIIYIRLIASISKLLHQYQQIYKMTTIVLYFTT